MRHGFGIADLWPEARFCPDDVDPAAIINQIALDLWLTFVWIIKRYKVREVLLYIIIGLDFYGWKERGWNNVGLIW